MDKQSVERAARELAEQMGPGWEPVVWENLGWHYTVKLRFGSPGRYAEIRERQNGDGTRSYSAEIYPGAVAGATSRDRDHVRCALQFYGKGKTPTAALAEALAIMEEEATTLNRAFDLARSELRKAR